jgi:hypothetical protein
MRNLRVYSSPNVTEVVKLRKMKWTRKVVCKPQNLKGRNFLKDQVWMKGKYFRCMVKRALTEFSCSWKVPWWMFVKTVPRCWAV